MIPRRIQELVDSVETLSDAWYEGDMDLVQYILAHLGDDVDELREAVDRVMEEEE